MVGSPGAKKFYEALSNKIVIDVLILCFIGAIVFLFAISFDVFEVIHEYSVKYESYEIDELITATIILVFALMIFSIRRWKEYERELKLRLRAENGLKEANNKLSLLTKITRHDIKNKIQTIFLYSEIIAFSENDEIKENAGIILGEAESIEKLIDFTRLYEELGSTEPQWYNLAEIFNTVGGSEEFSQITLRSDSCDVKIYADPLFEKAVYDLIENAVRHGEHTTTITLTCNKGTDDSLIIHFRDDGVGIPENMKSSIFKEGVGKNTGLGLFLVQEIFSITQISISEVGIEGKGADFLITVPPGQWKQ